jgi:CHASE3 domain sensor protein
MMPSQRVVLGIGLAILLVISAASIGLDVKSRSDAAWVDHTLGVLKKISDTRLLIRRAESAARGFVLTDDPNFVKEYRDTSDQIAPAFADLKETTKDNPAQTQLLESNEAQVARRLVVSSEIIRLHTAGDTAGMAALTARAQGRAAMEMLSTNFDKLAAEEERLLAVRTADSQQTRIVLLAIDLTGAALILMLAAVLTRQARRSRAYPAHV